MVSSSDILRFGRVHPAETEEPGAKPEGGAALVWREVLRGLYEGRYVQGQRLVEADMTRSLGVSRSSVREGFSRLAAEGVISLNRHRGAVVRVVGKAELLDMLCVLTKLNGLAAALAAQAVDPARDRAAADQVRAFLLSGAPPRDGQELVRKRNRLFRLLLDIGGNGELRRILRQMHVHPLAIQLKVRPDAEVLDEYVAILDAVMSGDPVAADAAARAHVDANIAAIRDLPAAAFTEEEPPRRRAG
jgi:DNA-binding GntR family transcriptional regulator